MWVIVGLISIAVGAITRTIFDQLNASVMLEVSFWFIVLTLMIVDLSGVVIALIARFINFFHFTFSFETLVRKNMFERILALPGASALIASPSEMISRFTGDAQWAWRLMQGWAIQHAATIIGGFVALLYLSPLITFTVFFSVSNRSHACQRTRAQDATISRDGAPSRWRCLQFCW